MKEATETKLPYILDLLSGTLEPKPDRISLQQCISVNRRRGGANETAVYLPTSIPRCKELIEREEAVAPQADRPDERDYYSDPERRIEILDRDKRTCVYCRPEVSEDSFVLDHLIPIANGGTNRRFNLVTSCEACNERKKDHDPNQFLLSNYRIQLLTQQEFLKQKSYIEQLLNRVAEVR